MQRVTGEAETGNVSVTTAGVVSTNFVLGSFPGATISVFLTGTNNLASLFGDNGVTPKANPFTAASDGSWFFYAANGRYDITIVGTAGGVTVSRTIGDVLLNDFASVTVTPVTVPFNANGVYDLNIASWFVTTLTGNVTAPTFPNAVKGSFLYMTLIQDAVGGRTFAWPGTFLRPPTIASQANAVTELSFKFDGTNWRTVAATGDNTQLRVANNIRFADQFATGSLTGGIAEAYADGPSTGVVVMLGADITISSAQVMALTTGKPLTIEGNGRTITFTHAAGVGLKITKNSNASPRDPFIMRNILFAYTGASNSITGVQLGDTLVTAGMVSASVFNCRFVGFNTTGAVALDINNFQDGRIDDCLFQSNTIGLNMELNTVQNQVANCSFQANATAVVMTDASEITFLDCLFQSNTGTKSFQVAASTTSINEVRFLNCHFENNGDGTANGRQIAFNASVGKSIASIVISSTVFNAGANVNAGSFIYDFSGAGSLTYIRNDNNHYFTASNFFSGFTGDTGVTSINDNAVGDVSLNCLNVSGAINAGSGIVLSPIGATITYQMHGGSPAFNNGSFIIRDCTNSLNILDYHSSTFQFLRQINLTGSTGSNANLIFTEQAASSGGASQDWLWGDSTAHRLKMNNNNAGATNVVGASDITATLKTGTGAGNYSTASTTYVRVDSTNLAYTVTIPVGWKLMIHSSGEAFTATAVVPWAIALADGTLDNTGILIESSSTSPTTSVGLPWSLDYIVTGDGASHTINLQYKTTNGADSVTLINSSATFKPTMTFLLTPSN